MALFTGWIPLDDIEARERADHAPYRDWIRAGFLRGCEGDVIDYEDVIDTIMAQARPKMTATCGLLALTRGFPPRSPSGSCR